MNELYYDEEPGRVLPAIEAEWPPEGFVANCFMCQRPLHPGDEARAGLCVQCRRRQEAPVYRSPEGLAELAEHYSDEAFLDATAEPLPGCFDLWPSGLRYAFVWRVEEFRACM